jgi:hypothetical protein
MELNGLIKRGLGVLPQVHAEGGLGTLEQGCGHHPERVRAHGPIPIGGFGE